MELILWNEVINVFPIESSPVITAYYKFNFKFVITTNYFAYYFSQYQQRFWLK